MRVLWFSNTPANASDVLGISLRGGGWLRALNIELENYLELHIAFYYPKRSQPFKHGNTIYHPIAVSHWKLKAIRDAFFNAIKDMEDIDLYLKIIDEVKPDLIHVQGTENPFGCIIGRTKVPVVISIQGIVSCIANKFLIGFSKSELRRRSISLVGGIKSSIFEKSFYRSVSLFQKMKQRELRNLRGAEYIIGRTAWDKRVCSILAPQSIYFHGDEMLRQEFYDRTWDDPVDTRIVIHTTSSDSPYKGFETICETLYELNLLKYIEIEWRVAGLDSESKVVKLAQKRYGDRFPASGLVLMGKLNEQQLIKSLMESSVFVSPSHIDNSPNSLCEAMLLGLPCIATFAGGTPSIIKDGEDGILCQDGDPLAIAGAILELHIDRVKARELGRRARERAHIRHDKSRVVYELLNTYDQILKIARIASQEAQIDLHKTIK